MIHFMKEVHPEPVSSYGIHLLLLFRLTAKL